MLRMCLYLRVGIPHLDVVVVGARHKHACVHWGAATGWATTSTAALGRTMRVSWIKDAPALASSEAASWTLLVAARPVRYHPSMGSCLLACLPHAPGYHATELMRYLCAWVLVSRVMEKTLSSLPPGYSRRAQGMHCK